MMKRMIINSTNINKTNDHPSYRLNSLNTKKYHDIYMTLGIHVLPCDSHTHAARSTCFIGTNMSASGRGEENTVLTECKYVLPLFTGFAMFRKLVLWLGRQLANQRTPNIVQINQFTKWSTENPVYGVHISQLVHYMPLTKIQYKIL